MAPRNTSGSLQPKTDTSPPAADDLAVLKANDLVHWTRGVGPLRSLHLGNVLAVVPAGAIPSTIFQKAAHDHHYVRIERHQLDGERLHGARPIQTLSLLVTETSGGTLAVDWPSPLAVTTLQRPHKEFTRFDVGNTVRWRTTAGGGTFHQGRIVAIAPAGEQPVSAWLRWRERIFDCDDWTGPYHTRSSALTSLAARNHTSYIVLDDDGALRWPSTSTLDLLNPAVYEQHKAKPHIATPRLWAIVMHNGDAGPATDIRGHRVVLLTQGVVPAPSTEMGNWRSACGLTHPIGAPVSRGAWRLLENKPPEVFACFPCDEALREFDQPAPSPEEPWPVTGSLPDDAPLVKPSTRGIDAVWWERYRNAMAEAKPTAEQPAKKKPRANRSKTRSQ
jgi:hypothetical protein